MSRIKHSLRSRRLRTGATLGSAGVLAAAMLAALPAAQAAPDDVGVFELDANVADGGGAGDDWASIFSGTDDAFTDTGIVPDLAPVSIFTGGGSKDDLDISGWKFKQGSVPDKDNITNAYTAAYTSGGDTFVYFGMDRFTTQGSADVGFWFLQDESFAPTSGSSGTFTGEHVAHGDNGPNSPGDVLILSEFSGGGEDVSIKVLEWVGTGGDEGGGTLQNLFGGDTGEPADCDDPGATADICANVNTAPILDTDIPWDYVAKNGSRNMPVASFFEGGINLSDFFDTVPCFTDVVAETRSSFEVNAVLKDLVASSFELCGADVSIAPDGVNDVGQSHTFTVTATRTVAGASEPAPLAAGDLVVTLTDQNGDPVTATTDECADTAQVDGTCDVTFSSEVPGVITGHVEGDISIGDTTVPVSTGGQGENPDAVKTYVDATINITPDDVNGIGESHTFTVEVKEDVGGAGFAAATVGHVSYTLTPAGGASATEDATATTCDTAGDNLDANGKCVIVFKSNTTGTVTGHASVTLRYDANGDGDSTDAGDLEITRSSDGLSDFGSANSDDAVKTYVDGTLHWLKHDGQGNLLGGAKFWVCRTESYDSSDGSFDAITDTTAGDGKDNDSRCEVVTDNAGKDTDATDGEFLLADLFLGTYTIQEKEAPTGYQIDPDTETVRLVIDVAGTADDESDGEPLKADGTSKPFVNLALFKLIVLTCNTTTEKLVASEVDLDPSTTGGKLDTLAAPPGALTDAQLCGLGGASYDDLTAATYGLDVKIPK